MELMEGGDIRANLVKKGPYPEVVAKRLDRNCYRNSEVNGLFAGVAYKLKVTPHCISDESNLSQRE